MRRKYPGRLSFAAAALTLCACGGSSTQEPPAPGSVRCQGELWTELNPPSGATHRALHVAEVVGDQVFIWGGERAISPGRAEALGTGYRFDPVTFDTFALPQQGAPAARVPYARASDGERVLLWGGYGGSEGPPLFGDGALYTAADDAWQPLPLDSAPPPRTNDVAAALAGGRFALWSGLDESGVPIDEPHAFVYDSASGSWQELPPPPAEHWYPAIAAVGPERFVLWGGYDSALELSNAASEYDATAGAWSSLPTEGAPAPRVQAFVRYLPELDELVVWGGMANDSFPDGGRFSFATETWRPIVRPSLLAGLADSAVTIARAPGPKLVVFGGSEAHPSNVVAIYDFASDTWLPPPVDECMPSARYQPSLTGVGDRVVVWGGTTDYNGGFPKENAWVLKLQ